MSINYESLIATRNPFWMRIEARKLEFLAWAMENPMDRRVQGIFNHQGERILEYGGDDDSNYINLCASLWHDAVNYDAGCSSTNEKCYVFVSQAVVWVVTDFLKIERNRMEKELKEHQQKIADITAQLKALDK